MKRVTFSLLAFALVFATIALVTFVGSPPQPQSTFHLRSDEKTILFEITPWGDTAEMRAAYAPLLAYLSEKTGKTFQLLIVEDYNTAIENIVEGVTDLAVLPPVSYVTAKEREPGLQYVSTIIREKEGKTFTTYRGYLVAFKEKYEGWTFDDFARRPAAYHLGFVTQKSSSGFAYPAAMMKRRDIDPQKDFKSITIYDRHPDVTDALVEGKIDLGATWEYNLEQAQAKHGDVFTIVWTSPPIPGLVWVAAKKLEPAFVTRVRELQLMIATSPELKTKLLATTPDKGWEIVDEHIYDEVREVLKYVGTFE